MIHRLHFLTVLREEEAVLFEKAGLPGRHLRLVVKRLFCGHLFCKPLLEGILRKIATGESPKLQVEL